ncbi:MAG: 3-phosphoglycerate dehydrogenase [Bacteroidetes bacterium]|nr:MAG: 3-phosphoglycerate dehydrogenase [Bacteroidota bacterium]
MKVLANDGVSAAGQKALEEAGYIVLTDHVAQENLAKTINEQGIEVLLVRSATTVRKDLIDACPGLKLIGRGGVGMDNIDVEYAREQGRTVINTPAASSQSVAELVMGQLFSISRFVYDSNREMAQGDFKTLKKKYSKGVELRGKKLGIVGFGRIGQSLASYALGVGMEVLAVDRASRHTEIPVIIGNGQQVNVGVEVHTDIMKILSEVDYISIHIPKQADGKAVLGEAELNRLKKGVFIVNAARGGVIDEQALMRALDSGQVAAAAMDVFENEPNPNKDLLNHPKISSTPHIGAATGEAQARIGLELAELIIEKFGVLKSMNV